MNLAHQILIEIRTLGSEGGWIFWALILLAFAIAWSLLSLWSSMRFPQTSILAPSDWFALLSDKGDSETIRRRLADTFENEPDTPRRLREVAQELFSNADRRIPFVLIMIGAAPLVGLLGTVSGMLTTFAGMSSSRGLAPIDTISRGISEALITTQTGLIIGVPTFIVCQLLKSSHEQKQRAFQKLESRILQSITTP